MALAGRTAAPEAPLAGPTCEPDQPLSGRLRPTPAIRAAAYGQGDPLDKYVGHANNQTLIAVHIETEAAIKDLRRITEIDAVDVIMIAPTDLSQPLGVPGQTGHPLVTDAIESIVSIVSIAPVVLGVLVANAGAAQQWLERGARYVGITFDALVQAGSGSFLAEARRAATAFA